MDSCTSRSTSSVFQSTLLMRGATCPSTNLVRTKPKFQSTLLMRGATSRLLPLSSASAISIHAPHARSDMTLLSNQLARPLFQSTLLMRGATRTTVLARILHTSFQSTLLMRGATTYRLPNRAYLSRISIHAPHARSDSAMLSRYTQYSISIHAPHARSD